MATPEDITLDQAEAAIAGMDPAVTAEQGFAFVLCNMARSLDRMATAAEAREQREGFKERADVG